jgi:hypothetical protein
MFISPGYLESVEKLDYILNRPDVCIDYHKNIRVSKWDFLPTNNALLFSRLYITPLVVPIIIKKCHNLYKSDLQ